MHSLTNRAHHHFVRHLVGGGIWLASALRFLGQAGIDCTEDQFSLRDCTNQS